MTEQMSGQEEQPGEWSKVVIRSVYFCHTCSCPLHSTAHCIIDALVLLFVCGQCRWIEVTASSFVPFAIPLLINSTQHIYHGRYLISTTVNEKRSQVLLLLLLFINDAI